METEYLILRRLDDKDAGGIFILRSDEKVNKYLNRPKIISPDQAYEFINLINNGISKNKCVYWAITLKNSYKNSPPDKLIGTICLWNINRKNSTAEIGYELLPDFQGKGMMQEAVKEVLEFGLQSMQLNTIFAFTHPENEKSTKLLERFNFRRDIILETKIRDKEESFTDIIYSLKKLNK